MRQNSKTQFVTKLKKKSRCYKTQEHRLRQNSKSQIVTKPKNSIFDRTPKLKLLERKKTQLKLWQKLKYDKSPFMQKKILTGSFIKNILTPWQPKRCSLGSVLRFSQCFSHNSKAPHCTALYWTVLYLNFLHTCWYYQPS